LLNRAARFFPILRQLDCDLKLGGTLLEVGSGSSGIGEFWKGTFVGCDMNFPTRPIRNMRPVICSGCSLPFGDAAFDIVVVSDVIEHVSPVQRGDIVQEALRVARKLVVIGYPCGSAAFAVDQKLYHEYTSRNRHPPDWLVEHMAYPFPDEDLFLNLPGNWTSRVIPNESLRFHYWMMRTEMFRLWNYSFRLALWLAPQLVRHLLQRVDREPSYRKIFVLTRRQPQLTFV
jgi:hypothetical protein